MALYHSITRTFLTQAEYRHICQVTMWLTANLPDLLWAM